MPISPLPSSSPGLSSLCTAVVLPGTTETQAYVMTLTDSLTNPVGCLRKCFRTFCLSLALSVHACCQGYNISPHPHPRSTLSVHEHTVTDSEKSHSPSLVKNTLGAFRLTHTRTHTPPSSHTLLARIQVHLHQSLQEGICDFKLPLLAVFGSRPVAGSKPPHLWAWETS